MLIIFRIVILASWD